MDQSRHPLPTLGTPTLAHDLLIASTAVRQASTRTAVLAERIARPDVFADTGSALVALFTDSHGSAAEMLCGSFHPRVAARKARSTLMKTGFTLAF